MLDFKLFAGIGLTLLGLWLLSDKLSAIFTTLQFKPSPLWAVALFVVLLVTAVLLRTWPPHVLWPLWTGLGLAAPVIVSLARGHSITGWQWLGIAFVFAATCFMMHEGIAAAYQKITYK